MPPPRLLTLQAMGALCLARLLIAWVPLRMWRGSLGAPRESASDARQVQFLAGRVERAAARLPFATKCLPRAMALSWMLRRYRLEHAVVLAIRPAGQRTRDETLHAWVETAQGIVLGDLPGPWHEVYKA